MDTILIDGKSYQLVSRVAAGRKNTLPKHTLGDATTATDHILIGAPTFDLNLILFPGEYETLESLSREQRLFTISLPQGTYNNVAFLSISDEYGSTANTTQCTISLAVQNVTLTITVPTELGGLILNPANQNGAETTTIEDVPDTATIDQLKEYYLDHYRGTLFDKEAERERLTGMSNEELWNTLIAVDMLNKESVLAAITYDLDGEYRQKLDHDMGGYLLTNSSKFNLNGLDGKPVNYGIVTRKEIRTIFNSDLEDIWSGEPVIHATITRSRDGAVVYDGPISDLTPFTATDPDTGETLATLQYSKYGERLYIA